MGEDLDQPVERDFRVRLLEGTRQLVQPTAGRQQIEERLEQAALRTELVVDRHASDIGPPRHGVDAEARLPGELRAGRGQDSCPGLVCCHLPLPQSVRTRTHLKLDMALFHHAVYTMNCRSSTPSTGGPPRHDALPTRPL